jgi:hypothetical protein
VWATFGHSAVSRSAVWATFGQHSGTALSAVVHKPPLS